ncbi:hypothetical protein MD484_g3738, partial [Candolleomyces efflorescens]
MNPPIPVDIHQEVIKHLGSDIQTLRSYALTSHACAQVSQPYIFRIVNLTKRTSDNRSRYNQLHDLLKENPTLANHTRELYLSIGDDGHMIGRAGKDYIDVDDPELPHFLGCFTRLTKLSIKGRGVDRGTQKAVFEAQGLLVEAVTRLLGLETLRNLTLVSYWPFSVSLLAHAANVTDLQLHSNIFRMRDVGEQIHPTSPASSAQFKLQSHGARTRVPLSLSLKECHPDTVRALARLVRARAGVFEAHWIRKLVHVLDSDEDVDENVEIRSCCELLQAVATSQRSGDAEVECLSHLALDSGT